MNRKYSMFLFILFALVTTFKVIQISDDNSNYIEDVTQTHFNQTYIFLTNGNVDYYYFQIYISTNYETASIALAASQYQAPYFDQSNKLIYQQFDSNGYLLKKNYLYLILTKSTLPYYITVLSEKSISYKIQSYSQYTQPCSESCKLFGSCYIGKCVCKKGWIGDDCTIQATEITQELTSYKSGYFYQQFMEHESIDFDITSISDGKIYFLFEANQISVPTPQTFDYELELLFNVPQKFSLQYSKPGAHKVIIYVPATVKVKFVSTQDGNTTTQENSYSNVPKQDNDDKNDDTSLSSDSIIIICTIVPISIIFLIAVALCVKCKSSKQQVFPQKVADICDGPIDYGVQFQKNEGDCSICLQVFKNPSDLRRTPCNHKFHYNCIREWINKGHTQCPMCRAEIAMNCLF